MRMLIALLCLGVLAGCNASTVKHMGSQGFKNSPGFYVEAFEVKSRDAFGQDYTGVQSFLTGPPGAPVPLQDGFSAGPGIGKFALPAAIMGVSNVAAARAHRPDRTNINMSQEGGGASAEGGGGGNAEGGAGGSAAGGNSTGGTANSGSTANGGEGGAGGTANSNSNSQAQSQSQAQAQSDSNSNSGAGVNHNYGGRKRLGHHD